MTKSELKFHSVKQLDRGLAYGEACFETFRLINGAVFAWSEHMSRLNKGLDAFGLWLGDADFNAIYQQVLSHAEGHGDDCLVRVTVTGGRATWGLQRSVSVEPEIYIQSMPFKPQEKELHLVSREWPFALQMKPAKMTSDYAFILQALHRWHQEGLKQAVTPLICKDGRMLSTPTANLLIYRDGSWYTPDAADGGVLVGILRKALLKAGVVHIYDCPDSWLDDCEAMAVTNSGCFIRAISTVNGKVLNKESNLFKPLYQALRGEPGVPNL